MRSTRIDSTMSAWSLGTTVASSFRADRAADPASTRSDLPRRRFGGRDTHGVCQGSYQVTSVRPSVRLVHVPGAELGRQINIKARSQSHNEGQAQPLAGDLTSMCVTGRR